MLCPAECSSCRCMWAPPLSGAAPRPCPPPQPGRSAPSLGQTPNHWVCCLVPREGRCAEQGLPREPEEGTLHTGGVQSPRWARPQAPPAFLCWQEHSPARLGGGPVPLVRAGLPEAGRGPGAAHLIEEPVGEGPEALGAHEAALVVQLAATVHDALGRAEAGLAAQAGRRGQGVRQVAGEETGGQDGRPTWARVRPGRLLQGQPGSDSETRGQGQPPRPPFPATRTPTAMRALERPTPAHGCSGTTILRAERAAGGGGQAP